MMQDTRQRRKWLLHSQVPGYCASMICRYKGDAADVTIENPDVWFAARLQPAQPNFDAEWWLTRKLDKPKPLLGEAMTHTTRLLLGGPTGIGKTRYWDSAPPAALSRASASAIGAGRMAACRPTSHGDIARDSCRSG